MEAQCAELIHEEAGAGAHRTDHLSERALTDLRNDRFQLAVFPKMGHERQGLHQPHLTGTEELLHQVLLDAS